MIGDKLTHHDSYQVVTHRVMDALQNEFRQRRICIAVGGESGCGKTSLAHALHLDIEKKLGLKGYLFHADDYFLLPPKDNHNQRLSDIGNVGVQEVNLQLLDQHIQSFLSLEKDIVEKPLVNYNENSISTELVVPKEFDFCIVEGTYTMLLNEPLYKVFIQKTYKDTRADRVSRARDLINDFNERVLEIEHLIISEQSKFADMII
jgi:uridine kinase